jgi:2-polyprenyl-3-methyl-5-hydroxy-6-metoxy-1,4-benzoquinol methylase
MAHSEYVKNTIEELHECSLLDIGCGTGNLSIDLANHTKNITAIDFDSAMLKMAQKKGFGIANLNFRNLNMLDIASTFPANSFDCVVCFGNTLVHLPSRFDIFDFLHQTKVLLKNGGKLLVQIINYDRILDLKLDHLPTIENDRVKFERNYSFDPLQEKMDFETILTIKKTGEQIKNHIELLPLRKAEIDKLLKEAGFSKICFYGNFRKDKLLCDSVSLVFEAMA